MKTATKTISVCSGKRRNSISRETVSTRTRRNALPEAPDFRLWSAEVRLTSMSAAASSKNSLFSISHFFSPCSDSGQNQPGRHATDRVSEGEVAQVQNGAHDSVNVLALL